MPNPADPNYNSRAGFDPSFLGVPAPLPRLRAQVRARAFEVPGAASGSELELKYHHFSVILNREARLAFVAAVNFDAGAEFHYTRTGSDRWWPDPRVDQALQAGNEFYSDNPLDRGHLVRRTDAAWGSTEEEARFGNDDTFHFTNCSPQHEIYNQARRAAKQGLLLWGNIEEHVAAQAAATRGAAAHGRRTDGAGASGQRLSIFNGPVFRATDRLHRGLAIPREYWKLIVYRTSDDPPAIRAAAFVLSQESLIANLPLEEFVAGPY
ncbi:MAG: DNA/RNA non-specific endonuclease, partial [Vicinamibacterales bacterium]